MCKRAVAKILNEVARIGERRGANPLRSLAAHLRETDDISELWPLHCDGHCVASDASANDHARGCLQRCRVRTARAKVTSPRDRQYCGCDHGSGDRGETLAESLIAVDHVESLGDDRSDHLRSEASVLRDDGAPCLVGLADHAGTLGEGEQRVLEEGLDEGPLLLKHYNLADIPRQIP